MWVRLPRVRFTVRRLMVGVAVAAVIIAVVTWSVEMWRVRQRRLKDAARFAHLAKVYDAAVARRRSSFTARMEPEQRRFAEDALDHESRYLITLVKLNAEYERAATYPWLPEPPIPPPPD
jgi:hypothetical protein